MTEGAVRGVRGLLQVHTIFREPILLGFFLACHHEYEWWLNDSDMAVLRASAALHSTCLAGAQRGAWQELLPHAGPLTATGMACTCSEVFKVEICWLHCEELPVA